MNAPDSTPIDHRSYGVDGLPYRITIFHAGSQYYAAWYCQRCLLRQETELQPNAAVALHDAQDAIGVHHADMHTPHGGGRS